MQLSNKHRPGLWDLYCGMRGEPQWEGQTLVLRGCGCEGGGAGAPGRDCPSIAFNWPMLTTLLSEYYRQRFVSLEGPLAAGTAAATAGWQGTDLAAAVAGGVPAGASLSSGSLSSVDLGEVAPVWGPEGLAAAAAAATAQQPGKPAGEGAQQPRQQRSKGPAVALRGMEPQPDSYLEVGGGGGEGGGAEGGLQWGATLPAALLLAGPHQNAGGPDGPAGWPAQQLGCPLLWRLAMFLACPHDPFCRWLASWSGREPATSLCAPAPGAPGTLPAGPGVGAPNVLQWRCPRLQVCVRPGSALAHAPHSHHAAAVRWRQHQQEQRQQR